MRINTANNNFWNFFYWVMCNDVRNVARDSKLPQQHTSQLHTLQKQTK